MRKECFNAEKAPAAIGPYSHAVKCGGFTFLSGQLGIDPATGDLVKGGTEEETRQALNNINVILEEIGLNFVNIIKTTVFLKDIKDFNTMNKVYSSFFVSFPPARSAFQVVALPKSANVEIEVIAYNN